MALSDTGRAIATVSELLQTHLLTVTDNVTVGRPQDTTSASGSKLNLFLYEIQFDPGLRQVALEEGQPAPLWLVLKYLLTAFDGDSNSDTIEAHSLLGRGMQALHALSLAFFKKSRKALPSNHEELKLKFEDTSSDLLSKIMQGSDEKYRCSVSFEVRPVMIATSESSSYSLLVGIDYQAGGVLRKDQGITQIPVFPTLPMEPTITAIDPLRFEADSEAILTIFGNHLDLPSLSIQLGNLQPRILKQSPTMIQYKLPEDVADGRIISAGSYPIHVVQTLPTGRCRFSNLLVAYLLPTLFNPNEAYRGSTRRVPDTSDSPAKVVSDIDLEGVLLGTVNDDVFIALYRNGRTVEIFELIPEEPEDASELPQTRFRFSIPEHKAVPPGQYRMILRVNGQQAMNCPEIVLEAPP